MWSICIVIFLNQSLRNQNKKCIITDLKPEYKVAIDKLRVKQQFCTFHSLPEDPALEALRAVAADERVRAAEDAVWIEV